MVDGCKATIFIAVFIGKKRLCMRFKHPGENLSRSSDTVTEDAILPHLEPLVNATEQGSGIVFYPSS